MMVATCMSHGLVIPILFQTSYIDFCSELVGIIIVMCAMSLVPLAALPLEVAELSLR